MSSSKLDHVKEKILGAVQEWTVLDVFKVSACFFSIFCEYAISSIPKRTSKVRESEAFIDTKLVLLSKRRIWELSLLALLIADPSHCS